jgi:multiple sugar transport system permease protein
MTPASPHDKSLLADLPRLVLLSILGVIFLMPYLWMI